MKGHEYVYIPGPNSYWNAPDEGTYYLVCGFDNRKYTRGYSLLSKNVKVYSPFNIIEITIDNWAHKQRVLLANAFRIK